MSRCDRVLDDALVSGGGSGEPDTVGAATSALLRGGGWLDGELSSGPVFAIELRLTGASGVAPVEVCPASCCSSLVRLTGGGGRVGRVKM